MKAIVYRKYGSPEVLKLEDVAKPAPKDNEVLVKVHATTVTPVDCGFRSADPFIARLFTGLFRPKNPILGTELAGEIEAVGRHVEQLKIGDQIFAAPANGQGAHAEYICLPATGALARIPFNMTYEQAAAVCNGALTALPFLRDNGKIARGHKVLINGASGSIGTFAVQLARHFGAHVTGVCSTANLDLVRSLGADEVIDYTAQDFTKTGQTFDIIFDTVGKSSFSNCKGALTDKGIYLSPVHSLGTTFQMLWTSITGGKKAIIAATGLRPASAQVKDLAILTELIEAEIIKPVIDRSYALEQFAEAHRYVETGHKKGNVVVTFHE